MQCLTCHHKIPTSKFTMHSLHGRAWMVAQPLAEMAACLCAPSHAACRPDTPSTSE